MTDLSALGALVRRHDPDRYFTALFAPASHRESLFALYAFNHELARAREAVREPMAALIRLQWWREVVEGARRRHEVAGPLGEALDEGRLLAADLAPMIDAREAETEPIETVAAFETYVFGTAGTVMVAAARTLGMAAPDVLRRPGAAYGVAGVLRSAAALVRQGRSVLPQDLLREGEPAARARLLAMAQAWLAESPRVPRPALPAALPLVFARRDLRRSAAGGDRPLSDRIAVLAAAVRARV